MNHARCNPVIQQASGTISRAIGLENRARAARIPHRMKTLSKKLCLALTPALVIASVRAENWPQWRGPHFDGSTTEQNLPAEFSKTNNVKWVAELPGPSAGTPIVWGDRVFVSSTDNRTKTLRAICLDAQT